MRKIFDWIFYNPAIKSIVSVSFLLLVLLFLSLFFKDIDLEDIKSITINYTWFIAAIFLMVLARFVFPFIWTFLLREFNLNLNDYPSLFYIYAKSWMGKYIPGNVMTITGKIFFGSQAGYDKKTLTIVSFLETFIQAITGLLSGLLIVGLVNRGLIDKRLALFSLLIGLSLLLVIIPPVFNKIISIAYNLLKKQTLPKKYHYRFSTFGKTSALFFIASLLPAIATSMLGYSIYPELNVFNSFFFMIGVLNLAGSLGLIAIFAPGGLGVREGVLALFLYVLFPKEILLVFIILIRLTAVLADIIFFGISWIIKTLK